MTDRPSLPDHTPLVAPVPSVPVSRLLVPLDGSERSARALPVATALGARLGVPVAVVDCVPPAFRVEAEREWVEAHTEAMGGLAEQEVHATIDVVNDILATAAATPGTVLCLSSHGASGVGKVVFGSVSLELILASPAPVVVVGPEVEVPTSFDTIQVAFDASASGGRTLDVAVDWATRLRATPWLTHVLGEVPDLDAPEAGDVAGDLAEDGPLFRAAGGLRAQGIDAEWDVLHGRRTADSLTDWARGHDPALLVVGCHRRALLDRVLGTVTGRVIQLAPRPVLVVGPSASPAA